MHRGFHQRSVDTHQFAMIPRADIPRSRFDVDFTLKTTFDSGFLVPVYVDEVLPGDHFAVDSTFFARLATPITPIMDNLTLESFFFFVPNRLVWTNWEKFQGAQDNPDDPIDFTIPQMVSPEGGYPINSLQDYMGLPTDGQVIVTDTVSHSALFLRAYNLIWNEWFRDENLQDSVVVDTDDGPDDPADYVLLRRGKRKDYFTSCLPWTQKGDPVSLPLGSEAPVVSNGNPIQMRAYQTEGTTRNLYASFEPGNPPAIGLSFYSGGLSQLDYGAPGAITTGLFADLSQATAATINEIRFAFQVQRLLERDARGGTRYTEILRSHWGTTSPDFRLQRPEYIGGGSSRVTISPVAQTSASVDESTPLANLSAVGTVVGAGHTFSYASVEHGMIIGVVHVRADLTYQQGLHRMWSRLTRYDFYMPVLSHLGEQAVLNKEIYVTGGVTDDGVFGYQERWAEYRYKPSRICGTFRSTAPGGTLDIWHLSQDFGALPTLSETFIEDNPPVNRVIAVDDPDYAGNQFLMDALFRCRMTRQMPLYSVPGLVDHF